MLGVEDTGSPFPEKFPGIEVYNYEKGEYELKHAYMTQADINEFDTPLFRQALRTWREFVACKALPHGMGTLHERQSVIRIITIFEEGMKRMESWTYENKDFL